MCHSVLCHQNDPPREPLTVGSQDGVRPWLQYYVTRVCWVQGSVCEAKCVCECSWNSGSVTPKSHWVHGLCGSDSQSNQRAGLRPEATTPLFVYDTFMLMKSDTEEGGEWSWVRPFYYSCSNTNCYTDIENNKDARTQCENGFLWCSALWSNNIQMCVLPGAD